MQANSGALTLFVVVRPRSEISYILPCAIVNLSELYSIYFPFSGDLVMNNCTCISGLLRYLTVHLKKPLIPESATLWSR